MMRTPDAASFGPSQALLLMQYSAAASMLCIRPNNKTIMYTVREKAVKREVEEIVYGSEFCT